MESSRRDLFIGMAVDRFVFKNNQITFFPYFTLVVSFTLLSQGRLSTLCLAPLDGRKGTQEVDKVTSKTDCVAAESL